VRSLGVMRSTAALKSLYASGVPLMRLWKVRSMLEAHLCASQGMDKGEKRADLPRHGEEYTIFSTLRQADAVVPAVINLKVPNIRS